MGLPIPDAYLLAVSDDALPAADKIMVGVWRALIADWLSEHGGLPLGVDVLAPTPELPAGFYRMDGRHLNPVAVPPEYRSAIRRAQEVSTDEIRAQYDDAIVELGIDSAQRLRAAGVVQGKRAI